MNGDFSRLTFVPGKHYDAVLTQQGRVTLDADLNEQWAIGDHRLRRTGADIIGPAGGPLHSAGFAITPGGGTLQIGAGIYYVDGLRVVNEAAVALNAQPDLPAGSPVFLNPPAAPAAAPISGRYLAFLDVWRRHITALEDPSLRETALTADTATRLKTVWQVRCLRLGAVGAAAFTCDADLPPWQTYTAAPTGRLSARAKAAAQASDPCSMPENAGYRRLENHLYRIEVHRAGTAGGGATFKWSRDNATLAVRWLAGDGENLTVSNTGRDRYSGFQNGQWIELTDDDRERRGEPGVLVRIKTVRGTTIAVDTLTAEGPIAIAGFGSNPKIRGWDGAGAAPIVVPGDNDGFLAIESGLEIGFSAGTYRSGDYWLAAARSGVGIEWPQNGGVPVAQAPHGIAHAYAKLAILDFDGANWTPVGDCRDLFPPLTELVDFVYLGGDGQSAMPDPTSPAIRIALGESLLTGVRRGEVPVQNARVRYRIAAGSGRLTGGVTELIVPTNAQGVAAAQWSLDGVTQNQQVTAELLNSANVAVGAAIRFAASLSRAAVVSFDPVNTPEISSAKTVQAAIEALYNRNNGGGCATYVLSPESDWVKILTELPKGEDAVICFRQGDYRSDQTVKLEGLGHVSLHGGGEATRIGVAKAEAALEFIGCESVTVRDLHVEANETGGEWSPVKHLNGVLTLTDCANVEVSGCVLRCGASIRNERTCLTVRISPPEEEKPRVPVRSARIVANRFIVGYGQTGVLVTDCLVSQIRDNQFDAQARPAALTFERLAAEPKRRALLAKQLIGRVTSAGRAAGARVISVGRYKVELNSPVAEAEWRALTKANPPKGREATTPEGVRTYMTRVAETGLNSAAPTGSMGRYVTAMRRAMGENAFNSLAKEARSGMILGDVTVTDTRDVPGTTAVLSFDQVNMAFNSPVGQHEWDAMVRAAPPSKAPADDRSAARYIRDLAQKAVADPDFRRRFTGINTWLAGFKLNNPSVGQQAIVCAGSLSREVQITGNTIQSFYEGIRVAVSDRGEKGARFSTLKSVTIADNSLHLRVPFEYEVGRLGMLVGNAERIRVSGNNLAFAEPRASDKGYGEGIRIWGHLGPIMILRENHVSVGRTGMQVTHVGPLSQRGSQQWLATDNMVDSGGVVLDAPPQVQDRNNAVL
ncbi:DUF6519 domain-containing protein [Caulobacter endophyticus]|uniref:DUF6519 domain-containing protein n=1 Tax=Caulobacter endophyticus TaxID=2172652 RepID=UPI0024104A5A|nr:DUF6519 domain-containing protein [Caulobacter endophyticus]MDG2527894.1 DUF6519 domain-containing protein [Caulobacter endophyticus]